MTVTPSTSYASPNTRRTLSASYVPPMYSITGSAGSRPFSNAMTHLLDGTATMRYSRVHLPNPAARNLRGPPGLLSPVLLDRADFDAAAVAGRRDRGGEFDRRRFVVGP